MSLLPPLQSLDITHPAKSATSAANSCKPKRAAQSGQLYILQYNTAKTPYLPHYSPKTDTLQDMHNVATCTNSDIKVWQYLLFVILNRLGYTVIVGSANSPRTQTG